MLKEWGGGAHARGDFSPLENPHVPQGSPDAGESINTVSTMGSVIASRFGTIGVRIVV